tara:strand:- start:171 stop:857 length:687 start_codon:yes stop_codon:yes gene_type:complete
MISGKSVLAIIPARGGSKELPQKNILPLAGKPLIVWSIEAANKSKYIDRCIVSTDDEEIAQLAKKYGCEVPFMRPAEFATDDANVNDVFLHVLDLLREQYDILVVLQPTSPLRESEDIDHALEMIEHENVSAVVSVCKSNKPLPWHFTIEKDGVLKSVFPRKKLSVNRQELSPTYLPNGALFIAYTDFFRSKTTFYTESTFAYIMPPERSVDIDTRNDFLLAEAILNN